jgi:predicted ATP-dependent endonuclease of OLD family
MSSQKEIMDKEEETSIESEPEEQTEELTEEQDTPNEIENGDGRDEAPSKPIRELTPQEKRKKALYQKTRLLTYGDFVIIPKGQTWEIETTLADSGHAQRKKYKSEDMEWKYVTQALIPHLDELKKHELRFTPKQGDKLQGLLELGYTRFRVIRNNEEGSKVAYRFEALG